MTRVIHEAMPSIGSLFSGYGGLDLAVAEVLGGTVAWHVDNDPAAARVLAHHWPDVPNLEDITTVDWTTVAPVDVLTGGFPCQDVSSAGRRAGMRPSTRSGLWAHMAYAINRLRPRLVVIENVRGLLSADAACDLEPCPWCVGDGEGRPLRALGGVLGDLAVLGYDAWWCGLRAADVGAPHPRFRVFITAWPAPDSAGAGRGLIKPVDVPGVGRAPLYAGQAEPGRRDREIASDAEGERWGEGWPEPARQLRGSDAALSGHAAIADALGGELQRRGGPGELAGPEGPGEGEGPQRQRDRHSTGDSSAAAADAAGPARGGTKPEHLGAPTGPAAEPRERAGATAWGSYGPAVRRWELILGRPAPAPTQAGKRGGQLLSPLFVEWLMGLPEGWVTGVPGLSRNDQLKLLGNGVVPQQASAALRWLLAERGQPAAMS